MTFARCLKCVMPNTRPDTAFVDGVCSACLSFERRPQIDWGARHTELVQLLDRHHGDVIVPSSGGKDSTYQVLTLLDMGAHVAVVTATTCMLTDVGRKNIDNLARYAPTVEVTPNRTVRAKLNRLGLTMVGDISYPEHCAIFSIPFRMACTLGIPLIVFGENSQDQYGSPTPDAAEAKQMTLRWRSEFGGMLGLRPADFVGVEGITERDMRFYEAPPADWMQEVGVEAHFLGQYIEWDSERNWSASSKSGMTWCLPSPANWWPAENQDNAMTGLHDHLMYRKFGYGRACAQVSVDVRRGRMDRETAMAIVETRDGLFPFEYMGVNFTAVLRQIGMSPEEFEKTLHHFTNWELFKREDNMRPILKEFA